MSDRLEDAGLPRVTVRGGSYERGIQYGAQARHLILRSVAAYEQVFAHYAGWGWARVREAGGGYLESIGSFAPESIDEMRGIAEGAGLEFEDVVALNVRSEIMFASGAGANAGISSALANECSSFAALPEAVLNGHTLAGQNWDWLLHALDTVVLLDVGRDDGPDYLTIVEAGLLAKTGINEAGIAVCTNTLVSELDLGVPGVPYHILLRSLLDAPSITDAVGMIFAADKALSANYLLADADGLAIDLEVVPGGATSVRPLMPENGILVHTNHFVSSDLARSDARVATSPNTLFRLHTLRSDLEREAPSLTVEAVGKALSDHRNAPLGVCCHGDDRSPMAERFATIVSVVYDLNAKEVHVAAGSPCLHSYMTSAGPGRGAQEIDQRGGDISAPNAKEGI